jgi:hypothetical protein
MSSLMSPLTGHPGVRRFAAVLVTVISLGAATTLAAKPADARVFFSFGFGVPAWGWGYYPRPGYWYRPYYPAYYGYRWQWRRWCYWHPYRCYR